MTIPPLLCFILGKKRFISGNSANCLKVMQQHIYYIRYALRFADMQIPQLVTLFNDQVQHRGWSSMHAYHDQALIDEFLRRGIDISAVCNGDNISFAHPIRYSLTDNKVVIC